MKLYKAGYVITDDREESDGTWEPDAPFPDPEGWAEHCQDLWGEYKPFFPPSDRPIYRSRSAAQRRVDLINRWFGDGAAVLMETETRWVETSAAVRRRRLDRAAQRAAKLRREADEVMRRAEAA